MLNPIEEDRLETERLVLRPPAYSDAAGLMEMLNDPAICRFSPHKVITDVATMHFAIVDWHERREHGLRTYVITLRDRVREPIGLYHLHADGEVGGGVSPRHAGRGIAMEALLALRRSGVSLPNAWTIIDAEHVDLIRFLEKANYAIDQRLPAYRVHPQISDLPRDCVLMRRKALGRGNGGDVVG